MFKATWLIQNSVVNTKKVDAKYIFLTTYIVEYKIVLRLHF